MTTHSFPIGSFAVIPQTFLSASIRRIPVHRLLVYSILSHNLFALILEIFCDHPLENRACLLAVPRCSQIFSPVCLPKTTLWNLANNTIASTTTLKFILSLHGVAAAAGAEGPVSNQERISKTNNEEIKLQRWQSHLFSCFTDFFINFLSFLFFICICENWKRWPFSEKCCTLRYCLTTIGYKVNNILCITNAGY